MLSAPFELTRRTRLCDDAGFYNPAAEGWSRAPLHICNLRGHFLRKKRWNQWTVQNEIGLFSAALIDLDYLAWIEYFFYDRHSGEYHSETRYLPLGRGLELGPHVEDRAAVHHSTLGLSFSQENGDLRLRLDLPWKTQDRLRADLTVPAPDESECLGLAVGRSRNRFQYRCVRAGLPVKGTLSLGRRTENLDLRTAFARLDFGRGVWNYRTEWAAAAGAGRIGGQPFALNLGLQSPSPGAVSENAVFLDGRLHKLAGDVVFAYRRENYSLPWTIRSADSDELQLSFFPEYERISGANRVLVGSDIRSLYGRFRGALRLGRKTVKISDLFGSVAERRLRW